MARVSTASTGRQGLAEGGGGVVLGGDEVDRLVFLADLGDDGGVDLGVGPGEEGGLGQAAGAVAFGQAADVALGAGEGGVEPEGEGAEGLFLAEGAGGEDDDVGVVVLAGELGDGLVGDDGGADAGKAVGDDAHADAGGAEQDAALGAAFDEGLADGDGEVGVVVGGGRVEGTHVLDRVAAGLEEVDNLGLQGHPGVVAPNRNRAHSKLLAKRMRIA